jgi:hypothetical protein
LDIKLAAQATDERYDVDGVGHIALLGPGGDRRWTSLCNFTARVVDSIVYPAARPGGRGHRHVLIKAAGPGGQTRHADVPAWQFASLGWVIEQLGPNFIVAAGHGVRSHLARAIRANSPPALARLALDARPVCRGATSTRRARLPRRPSDATPILVGKLACEGLGLTLVVRCPKCRIRHHHRWAADRPLDAPEWVRQGLLPCDDIRPYPRGYLVVPDPRHETYHRALLAAHARRAGWRRLIEDEGRGDTPRRADARAMTGAAPPKREAS